MKKWAVPPGDAESLARGYSTPSGHAMSAASFYSYLYRYTKNRYFKILSIAAIILIGFSRPYLGVHYGEDVVLGWALGLCCAVVAAKYFDAFCARWIRLPIWSQVGIAVAASFALWLLTYALNGSHIDGVPRTFLGDLGFLTGIVIARPLELRLVNFDPRGSNSAAKILRFLLTGFLVLCTLIILDLAFRHLSAQIAWLELVLQYVRYIAAAVVLIFLAPLLFTRMGLARSTHDEAN
jgi:hypothetical protein